MSNREIFIDKLKQLSKEEMLERYIALLNTEKLTDLVAEQYVKIAELEKQLAEQPKVIVEKIKMWKLGRFNYIDEKFDYDADYYYRMIGANSALNDLENYLDTILKENNNEN